MVTAAIWQDVVLLLGAVALIVVGAELFAEHLARASARLGVSAFALALLLAGAEPEELATAVTAGVRDVPAVAFGDVVGANAAICLVALGVGAVVSPLPFDRRIRRYALLSLPVGIACVAFAWDGAVGRIEGSVLVLAYVAYVASIWIRERQPPSLGETAEVQEALERDDDEPPLRSLLLVLVGVAAIVSGAVVLVQAVEGLADVEPDQTRISLTLVGFATAFELVVLAWSSARRGISDAVIAAVVGSYAYNATLTLGLAAVVTPLRLDDVTPLRTPMLWMLAAMVLVLMLASRAQRLDRRDGAVLLGGYALFVLAVLVA